MVQDARAAYAKPQMVDCHGRCASPLLVSHAVPWRVDNSAGRRMDCSGATRSLPVASLCPMQASPAQLMFYSLSA